MPEHAQLDSDRQPRPTPLDRADEEWPRPNGHAAQLHRAILHDLRAAGPSSPDEVGRRVGTSRTSALQQLRALEAAGLAHHATVKHGVGRPRHVYDLTPVAQGLFPANYDGLATDMLAAIEAVGGQDLVGEVFRARRVAVEKRVRDRLADRLPEGATLAERVHELAVIQDEAGYFCRARRRAGRHVDPPLGAQLRDLPGGVEPSGRLRRRARDVRRRAGRRRRPRVAHHGRRPLLLVPHHRDPAGRLIGGGSAPDRA